MTFADRMSELFLHGELIADVLKDATKAVLLGGALSIINLFLTEQREAQRTRLVRDYAELIRLRDLAKSQPGESIGVVPLQYIEDRITHLEAMLQIAHAAAASATALRPGARHSRWDTAFSITPAVFLALMAFFMLIGIGSVNIFQVAGVVMTCLAVLVATYCLGRWTARVLDSMLVRRLSQVFISATLCFIGFIVSAVIAA